MSFLENRLHLGRRQCEERRRYLAGLEALAQRLRADERRLQAEIEGDVAGWRAPEEGAGQPAFAKPLILRHGKLARSVAAIDAQIAEVGAALDAAEQELKRRELAAARRATATGLPEQRRVRRSPRARQAVPPIAGPDRGG